MLGCYKTLYIMYIVIIECECTIVTGFMKTTLMSQELKSKLCPSVNDSPMHCPRTSTAWP